MSEWFDKKIIGSVLIIVTILIAGYAVYALALSPTMSTTPVYPPGVPGGVPTTTYSEGLTTSFKIFDSTTSSLVTSGNVVFYLTSDNPFALVNTATPVGFGAYDAGNSVWLAVLNAGTYNVLVYDDATIYPLKATVTVPPATTTDLEVNLNPYMITVVERSTPSILSSVAKYNSATGLYEVEMSGEITATGTDDRWQVTYMISAPGLYSVVKEGRGYLTTIPGLSVSSVTINGQPVAVSLDSVATDDGLTGTYFDFPDMPGGSSAMVQVVLTRTTASLTSGDFTATIVEQYENANPVLRYWADETDVITVNAYP